MKSTRLVFKYPAVRIMHPVEVERLKRVYKQAGYKISSQDAQRVWEEYSSTFSSKWLHMDHWSDEHLYQFTREFLHEG